MAGGGAEVLPLVAHRRGAPGVGASPCKVLNKRCAGEGEGCLFPAAEGMGPSCRREWAESGCWGDREEGGVVGGVCVGAGHQVGVRVCVAIPTWVCVCDRE